MSSRKARKRGEDVVRRSSVRPAATSNGAWPPPSPAPWRSAAPWALLALLLAAAAVGYWPALHGEFHFDDWGSIQANMRLRQPGALRLPGLEELLLPSRVVTLLTFAADYRAVGLAPFRYHVISLLVHLAAGVLAFLLSRRLLTRAGHPPALPLALLAAGAFLLLPEEAAARWRTPRGGAAWAGGVGAWLLAMGSKAIAIAAPAAFALDQAVVAPQGERGAVALWSRTRRALLVAAPAFSFAAWSAWLHLRAFSATPQTGVGFQSLALPVGHYLLTQRRVQWLYLRLLAWPDALALDRTFDPSRGLDAASALAGLG